MVYTTKKRKRVVTRLEIRDKIVQQHEILRNHQFIHGATNSHPQEDSILSEIKSEYENLDKLQTEKMNLSKKALELVLFKCCENK